MNNNTAYRPHRHLTGGVAFALSVLALLLAAIAPALAGGPDVVNFGNPGARPSFRMEIKNRSARTGPPSRSA